MRLFKFDVHYFDGGGIINSSHRWCFIALILACHLYFSEHITDVYSSSLSMSTPLNMHILNACAHNVSLYTNITDQWVRSRSLTMLSISLVINVLYMHLYTCMYVYTCLSRGEESKAAAIPSVDNCVEATTSLSANCMGWATNWAN